MTVTSHSYTIEYYIFALDNPKRIDIHDYFGKTIKHLDELRHT
jgi:hypothetical protein